jgi:hypothetical protein
LIHFISLASWFGLLLRRYSKILLGGFNLEQEPVQASLLLETFWGNYAKSNPDHVVFQVHAGKASKTNQTGFEQPMDLAMFGAPAFPVR